MRKFPTFQTRAKLTAACCAASTLFAADAVAACRFFPDETTALLYEEAHPEDRYILGAVLGIFAGSVATLTTNTLFRSFNQCCCPQTPEEEIPLTHMETIKQRRLKALQDLQNEVAELINSKEIPAFQELHWHTLVKGTVNELKTLYGEEMLPTSLFTGNPMNAFHQTSGTLAVYAQNVATYLKKPIGKRPKKDIFLETSQAEMDGIKDAVAKHGNPPAETSLRGFCAC